LNVAYQRFIDKTKKWKIKKYSRLR
jgi:hypothetical protein